MPVSENAERLDLFFEAYRRADGDKWKGTELGRATNGVVSSAYVTGIRSGAIKQPSDKYRKAMSRAMNFPFSYWFMDVDELRQELRRQGLLDRDGSGRRRSEWAGGEVLADLIGDQVAWMMLERGVERLGDGELAEESGRFTEEEMRVMRRGDAGPLTEAQALALSDLFGIAPSYWRAGPPRRDLITPEAASRILRNERILLLQDSEGSAPENVRNVVQGIAQLVARGGARNEPGENLGRG